MRFTFFCTILLSLLFVGCIDNFNIRANVVCDNSASILRSLDSGFTFVFGNARTEEVGSCNYQKVYGTELGETVELVLAYVNRTSLANDSIEVMQTQVIEVDVYEEATFRSEVLTSGDSVYVYVEGKRKGIDVQSVVLRKGTTFIQLSVVGKKEQWYSQNELIDAAQEVASYFAN